MEIRKLELDTTIIIITKVRYNTTPTTTTNITIWSSTVKVDEGELVECKIVIFLPLAGGFERRWRGGGVRL